MNNYNIFKNYCREYLECAAVLNYLKKQDNPDINHLNYHGLWKPWISSSLGIH